MIRLFSETDTTFTSNGDIVLRPLKAKVHKADNGDFYLDLETSLEYSSYFTEGRIVVANTPQGDQAFRIGNVTKSKNKLSSRCWHVFYDSENYIIADSNVVDKNCNDALVHLNNATTPQSEFVMYSDIATINSYRCVRKSLYEAIKEVLERWGGHLVRNNFRIAVVSSIGSDNGITIQYKKNLADITCSENWDNVVTKILPVGQDGILLNEVDPTASIYIESATQYAIPYVKVVDFSQDFNREDFPDEISFKTAVVNDLRTQATAYLSQNSIPQVNYTLKANLDRITDVGDTIQVIDERLGVNLLTNVISYDYDCIIGRYSTVEFGNFKQNLSNLVSNMTATAVKVANEASQTSTDQILGMLDDFVKSKGTSSGWEWKKYNSKTLEAWKQVEIDSADITWATFMTSLKSGTIDIDFPFSIENPVVVATMNNSGDIGWVAGANSTSTKTTLLIVREGNTGTMTVNIHIKGIEPSL